jgi:hypothetical protein
MKADDVERKDFSEENILHTKTGPGEGIEISSETESRINDLGSGQPLSNDGP